MPIQNPSPSTVAYMEYASSQHWAIDPELMSIEITTHLLDRVEAGLALLRGSGFSEITDTSLGIKWGLLTEGDEGYGYEPFEPEYTLRPPEVTIAESAGSNLSFVQFMCDFEHSADRGWCEISGADLVGYADKAWVESYGHVFVQLPDAPDGTPGKWLCVDRFGGPDGFAVQCDSLMECIEEAATWLESGLDEDAFPRPALTELRKTPPGY